MLPNHINNAAEKVTTRKFKPGELVIVEKNVRDENDKITGTIPELGWSVIGEITTGEDKGKILVRKIDGDIAYEKSISPQKLDRIQKSYQIPEKTGQASEILSNGERREIGHEGLVAAEVPEPTGEPNPFSYEAHVARLAKQAPAEAEEGLEDIEGSDLDDLIRSLDPQKRARDKIELTSYAAAKNAALAIEAKGGDAKNYVDILDQNMNRMSPDAKAIADQYARLYGLQGKIAA